MSKLSPEEEHYYYTPEGRHEKQGCGSFLLAICLFIFLFLLIGVMERCS